MGSSAILLVEPPAREGGDLWTRTDGKDFASVLFTPRCRELLEEHTQADLGAALDHDQWHCPNETVAALDAMLSALPTANSAEWSGADWDQFFYLYTELSGELADAEYFHRGFFVQDLRDLRAAVVSAAARGAVRVRLFVA